MCLWGNTTLSLTLVTSKLGSQKLCRVTLRRCNTTGFVFFLLSVCVRALLCTYVACLYEHVFKDVTQPVHTLSSLCFSFRKYPLEDNGKYIDGVLLFYPTMIDNKKHKMVCLDVRSTKFIFINVVDQDLSTNTWKFQCLKSLIIADFTCFQTI